MLSGTGCDIRKYLISPPIVNLVTDHDGSSWRPITPRPHCSDAAKNFSRETVGPARSRRPPRSVLQMPGEAPAGRGPGRARDAGGAREDPPGSLVRVASTGTIAVGHGTFRWLIRDISDATPGRGRPHRAAAPARSPRRTNGGGLRERSTISSARN